MKNVKVEVWVIGGILALVAGCVWYGLTIAPWTEFATAVVCSAVIAIVVGTLVGGLLFWRKQIESVAIALPWALALLGIPLLGMHCWMAGQLKPLRSAFEQTAKNTMPSLREATARLVRHEKEFGNGTELHDIVVRRNTILEASRFENFGEWKGGIDGVSKLDSFYFYWPF